MTTEKFNVDGPYENVFLNVGGKSDRSSFTRAVFQPSLTQPELEAMYESDGFARRIIDLPADEMVRAGYEIEGVEDEADVRAQLEGISAMSEIANAIRWAALYGGSLIVMIVNDGGGLEEPLNLDAVTSIEQLRVYDRWQVSRGSRYEDPADQTHGKTAVYHVSPCSGMPYLVHESRCLIFDGAPVPSKVRERNDGWGASKLQQAKNQLVRFNMGHYWSEQLLERSQQAVHGIPELTALLRDKGGEDLVRRRVELVDLTRSINNTVVIDSAESYDLKSTPLSGVPDILDRQGLALSAVVGIPESVLFGRQQGGLNSTGKAETDIWRSKIIQDQNALVLPSLDKLVGIQLRAMGKYVEDYLIKFKPLSVTSDAEAADTDLKKSQAIKMYWDMQAIGSKEVRSILENEGYIFEPDDSIDADIDSKTQAEVMKEYLGATMNNDEAPKISELDLLQAEKLRAEIEALKKLGNE